MSEGTIPLKKKHLFFAVCVAVLLVVSLGFGLWTAGHRANARRGGTTETGTEDIPFSREETTVAPWQEWPVILVNRTHAVPDDYAPPLLTLPNGQQFDTRMYPEWQKMVLAAKEQGLTLEAAYCYRSRETQQEILDERIAWYRKEGNSAAEAERKALEYVAKPGHSEHELGLAVDIHAEGETKPELLFAWLKENAHLYGFVERYPEDKVAITGIAHERWHYRFVGVVAATEMHEKGIVLEEYLNQVD